MCKNMSVAGWIEPLKYMLHWDTVSHVEIRDWMNMSGLSFPQVSMYLSLKSCNGNPDLEFGDDRKCLLSQPPWEMSKLKHRETSLATNCLCLLFSCKSFFFFFCIKYSAFKVIKNFRLHLWPDLAASLIIFFANAALATELQCRRTKFKPWVRKIPWRRKWQPTPVFLPGKSHGQGAWGATVDGIAKGQTWLTN